MIVDWKKPISPSEINEFLFCPRRWALQNIFHASPLPEVVPALEFGRSVHEAIAEYYAELKKYEVVSRELVQTLIRKFFEKHKRRIEGIKEDDWNTVLSNFLRFEFRRLDEWGVKYPKFVEKKLKTKLFSGIVDAYFPNGFIVDWKTSNVASIYLSHDDFVRQGTIYYLLLREYGEDVKRVYFYFLRSGKLIEIQPKDERYILQYVQKMVEMIREGKFPPRNDRLCQNCIYRLACKFLGKAFLFDFSF